MSQKPNNVLRAKENALPKTGPAAAPVHSAMAMQKKQLLTKKVSIVLSGNRILQLNMCLNVCLAND